VQYDVELENMNLVKMGQGQMEDGN
jgi:hypothetical protein